MLLKRIVMFVTMFLLMQKVNYHFGNFFISFYQLI